ILDDNKMAKHAGRSIWEGRYNLDNYSIGIEIVGYHNKRNSEAQYIALRQLIALLQQKYNIPDRNVITHSMVAYGSPNKWHNENHRGRKRCAMLFATPEVRRKLGLTSKPTTDPDVMAGRVVVADKYLNNILYGSSSLNNTKQKSKITDATRIEISDSQTENEFEGFREIGVDGINPWQIAGKEYASSSTVYFLKDGKVRRGDQLSKYNLNRLPQGTKILVGYVYGGHVSRGRSPIKICGSEWNYPSTYYRLPDGVIKSGDEINQQKIPKGTLALYRR
ncbi:MAG: peptidoglycan recognition family protein, partial [Nanoarchaeota archaeon]